jgi:hypothetical protein
MRWVALGVDYEMAGKDLIDSVKLSSEICRTLGASPPEGFNYELFLDEHNQKISKTKGNGFSMEEWLRYATPESLAYYMFQSPKSAKRLYFDVAPKAADEYLQQLDAFNRGRREANAPSLDNPAWHVHRGDPPAKGPPVSFSLLLNLVSAADASTKEILWGFLSRYLPGATPETEPLLDRLADYAIHYYEDFVKPAKRFRAPTAQERAGRQAEGPAARRRRRGHPERGVRGRQGRRLRAAAPVVRRALRGAAGPEPGPALRLLRRHLRDRPHDRPDRPRPGRRTGRGVAKEERELPQRGSIFAPPYRPADATSSPPGEH